MSITWLHDLAPTAVARAGAKLSRLAELIRAGVEVPPGFVVPTEAYRQFLESSKITPAIDAEVARIVSADDVDALTLHSERIQSLFEHAPIDAALASEISEAYETLCDRKAALALPVAVRSSATGEDAADASFAGQFDTYLGLTGAPQVIDGVKRCWASLFTPRALGYRHARELSHHVSPMAVGVLELVNARSAGVAFSIHPVSGKRDRIVIEASWGWGEAIVQGLVTPDHYEIDKADGRVLAREIKDKAIVSMFDYQQGRVVEGPMPQRLRRRAVLDDEELAELASVIQHIETHYGYPVDVEWVIARERRVGEPVTVVQVRPETVQVASAKPAPKWDVLSAANQYVFNRK